MENLIEYILVYYPIGSSSEVINGTRDTYINHK
jgi:hypothetical protein